MSKDYTLRCDAHGVMFNDPDVIQPSGRSGYYATVWVAHAGWLLVEAEAAHDLGNIGIDVQCWSTHCMPLARFVHEHADCGGLTVMSDQGGGMRPETSYDPETKTSTQDPKITPSKGRRT